MIAPTATCAVAMSAALLLQIVHAPSVIWQTTRNSHEIDNLRNVTLGAGSRENPKCADRDCDQGASSAVRHLKPDLKRVTSDKPRASRQALIFAIAEALMSGIKFAVGSREVENRQVAMLMSHGRAQPKLKINQRRSQNRQPKRSARLVWTSATESDSRIRH